MNLSHLDGRKLAELWPSEPYVLVEQPIPDSLGRPSMVKGRPFEVKWEGTRGRKAMWILDTYADLLKFKNFNQSEKRHVVPDLNSSCKTFKKSASVSIHPKVFACRCFILLSSYTRLNLCCCCFFILSALLKIILNWIINGSFLSLRFGLSEL